MNSSKITHFLIVTFIALSVAGCGGGDSSENKQAIPQTPVTDNDSIMITISAPESDADIYLDGQYTGKTTPAEIAIEPGEHTVGIGLNQAQRYLKKSLVVTDSSDGSSFDLTNDDLQTPKNWKALFIGVNRVQAPDKQCISEYTTEQLDAGFAFLEWSFEQRLQGYSYNTVDWTYDRIDINEEVVTLNHESLLTPTELEPYLTLHNINKGDYDFIVTFFRGGDVLTEAGGATEQNCYLGQFRGIGWFDYNALSVEASYVTIRYWDNIINAINYSKEDERDPGMFIHEWLHAVAEVNGNGFFKGRGYTMPVHNNEVVHAAGAYQYTYPWMTWYKDIIQGKVVSNGNYVGITPEAFLACSVREQALDMCE